MDRRGPRAPGPQGGLLVWVPLLLAAGGGRPAAAASGMCASAQERWPYTGGCESAGPRAMYVIC